MRAENIDPIRLAVVEHEYSQFNGMVVQILGDMDNLILVTPLSDDGEFVFHPRKLKLIGEQPQQRDHTLELADALFEAYFEGRKLRPDSPSEMRPRQPSRISWVRAAEEAIRRLS